MPASHPNVALITGGSRGIGAATAKLLASQGYKIVVNYAANQQAAEAVVQEVAGNGGQAMAVQGDVGNERDILSLFKQADAAFGRLGVLINNAGIVDVPVDVANMTAHRLERMMRINVIGSFLCAREAVNRMAISKGGAGGIIVNLSSAAARLGSPHHYVDYAASKSAIDTFTKGLALEVADDGIRVNAVRPGIIDTDIHSSGGTPDRVKEMEQNLPMRRGGTAQEVAQAIGYLVSDASSYITGTTLDVTGGR